MDEVPELPRHHSSQPSIFIGGTSIELVIDGDGGRHHLSVPKRHGAQLTENVARRMVLIYVQRRATGHISEPDRFIEVLNGAGAQLARIDDSDTWELRVDSIQRICDLAGIDFAMEHYDSEADLLEARPDWTPAHIALEVKHPVETDLRDLGMALWYGTAISFALLAAGGMQFIFGTPVRYAVLTLAVGGLAGATLISLWARFRWGMKRKGR
jgi:hypothetical protein